MGRHIGFGDRRTAKLDMEIVGVVRDVKMVGLKQKPTEQVWIPAIARRTSVELDVLYPYGD